MDQKLKILMVSWHTDGGVVHYTYNLCQALSDQNVEVLWLTSRNNKEISKFKRSFKLIKLIWLVKHPKSNFEKITFIPSKLLAYLYNSIIIIYKAKDFKIIHFQWYIFPRLDYYLFIFLKKFLRKKIVYTVHNLLPHELIQKDRAILTKLYQTADVLITHDEYTKTHLVLDFGVGEEIVKKIYHGNYNFFLDYIRERDVQKLKKDFGILTGSGVILFFGGIREYKGLDVLIKAFDKIHKRVNVTLLIVGGARDFRSYRSLIDSIKSKGKILTKIEYIPIEETYKYFLVSNLMVAPYRNTYFSGSILLSYSFSKPVISTRTGGIPEMVEEGKTGWLVKSGDVEELAKKIELAMSNKEKIKEMGKHAFEVTTNKYNWKESANKTREIYESLYIHPST